eukprot:CAMPEP_0205925876 /NCGR_PEP_ID=MMETSP1325-20131115/19178_1 /ASSEMBLY_ACC=CAM_ASM_000708 /TAXON_ID=236786 /ORGANISM="Florenciella sp., Strain RCC1007" /LENGTH=172 /DNA_ID=CAMNT_0053294485 /DNA_START=48 /DNA_END=566 /DNA_ORIENTATION=+
MKLITTLLLVLAATTHAAKLHATPRVVGKLSAPKTPKPATTAALQLRGGGIVSQDAYLKFWSATGAIYGLQCLLLPGTMTSMHYDAASTQMTEFWLRGMSVMMFAASFLVLQVDPMLATKVALIANVAIGTLLPWNGKFKWIGGGPGAAAKPAHVLPELLLVVQSTMGLLAL